MQGGRHSPSRQRTSCARMMHILRTTAGQYHQIAIILHYDLLIFKKVCTINCLRPLNCPARFFKMATRIATNTTVSSARTALIRCSGALQYASPSRFASCHPGRVLKQFAPPRTQAAYIRRPALQCMAMASNGENAVFEVYCKGAPSALRPATQRAVQQLRRWVAAACLFLCLCQAGTSDEVTMPNLAWSNSSMIKTCDHSRKWRL